MSQLTYIDLFAGAGGLSEGFIREGFHPVAHVEMNKEACDTLTTRLAFHYLTSQKKSKTYFAYLKNEISREALWSQVPRELIQSVINSEISNKTIQNIFGLIDEKLGSQRQVDLIIGGPPCQAYSLVGRSRSPNKMRWDKRNFLFRYYAEFLKRYKPKYFVFENVLGLLTAGNAKYLNQMLDLFDDCGYSIDLQKLNAEDYGVLQKRRRVIIIGQKGKRKFEFPKPDPIENEWQIKKDLLFDLPTLKPGDSLRISNYTKEINDYLKKTEIRNGVDFVTQHITRNHNARDLKIYSIALDKWVKEKKRLKYNDVPQYLRTHKNTKSFLDRYKVVDPTGHSHTVVAHIAKDGHYYIYPDSEQVRSISVREAARIQSFPDDYFFEGGRTAAFKQIGNAVPPLMAHSLAKTLVQKFLKTV